MNHESDDAMFDVLLAEAVGGPRPPDLTQRILETLQAQSSPPGEQSGPAQQGPETEQDLRKPAPAGSRRVASDAPMPRTASRPSAPAIILPPAAPRQGQRKTVLVCAWIASLAASVVLAGLFFSRPSEPLVSDHSPGSESPVEHPSPPEAEIPADARPGTGPSPTEAGPQIATAAEPLDRNPPATVTPAPSERRDGEGGPDRTLAPQPALAEARDPEPSIPSFPVVDDAAPLANDPLVGSLTASPRSSTLDPAAAYPPPPEPLADEAVIARIDTLLRSAWQSAGIEPTGEVDVATWSDRLSQTLGSTVAIQPAEAGRSGKPVGASESIRRALATPQARQTISRKFARTLLGRVGAEQLNEDQLEAFARWLSPALGGNIGFDAVAAELLTARGSSATESSDFNPASIWLNALAGPRSVPLVEQFGHAMLDLDLRCGRCHDHPLDGRVWQNQYWELNAVFQTSLRWSADQGRALRVETVPVSARGADAVVFFELPDGRQRAVSPRTAWQWIAGSVQSSDAEQIARQAGELEGLAAALKSNPQLARAAVNRLWETVYGGPLIGSAADPSAPPESEPLLQLQAELAEQLRAHDFDLGRALSWIAAAAPMRLQSPAALAVERYELASNAELRAAGEQLRHYAGYPPHLPEQKFNGLVAMVQRWSGDPTALAAPSDSLLGQLAEPVNPGTTKPGTAKSGSGKQPASSDSSKPSERSADRADEWMLRAIYDSSPATAPVEWLNRVGTDEDFDERALHLFYLAGYWNPSASQRAAAESLRNGDDDAAALGRLWWILSKEKP